MKEKRVLKLKQFGEDPGNSSQQNIELAKKKWQPKLKVRCKNDLVVENGIVKDSRRLQITS